MEVLVKKVIVFFLNDFLEFRYFIKLRKRVSIVFISIVIDYILKLELKYFYNIYV